MENNWKTLKKKGNIEKKTRRFKKEAWQGGKMDGGKGSERQTSRRAKGKGETGKIHIAKPHQWEKTISRTDSKLNIMLKMRLKAQDKTKFMGSSGGERRK